MLMFGTYLVLSTYSTETLVDLQLHLPPVWHALCPSLPRMLLRQPSVS